MVSTFSTTHRIISHRHPSNRFINITTGRSSVVIFRREPLSAVNSESAELENWDSKRKTYRAWGNMTGTQHNSSNQNKPFVSTLLPNLYSPLPCSDPIYNVRHPERRRLRLWRDNKTEVTPEQHPSKWSERISWNELHNGKESHRTAPWCCYYCCSAAVGCHRKLNLRVIIHPMSRPSAIGGVDDGNLLTGQLIEIQNGNAEKTYKFTL